MRTTPPLRRTRGLGATVGTIAAEGIGRPGADLPEEELTTRVIPEREDECVCVC